MKLKRLDPRVSGRMGMLGDERNNKPLKIFKGNAHLANGAEGFIDLGANRGEGLGVRKTCKAPKAGTVEADYYFNKLPPLEQ